MWACSSFCGSVWRSRPLGGRSIIMWRMSSGMYEGRCHHTWCLFLLLVYIFKNTSLTEEKKIYIHVVEIAWTCVMDTNLIEIFCLFYAFTRILDLPLVAYLPHRFIDCHIYCIYNIKTETLGFHWCLYVFTHKVCAGFTCALFIIQF